MRFEKSKKEYHDPFEKSFELLKKSQEEFYQDPFWQELKCSPDIFFAAVQNHIQQLNIPAQQLKQRLEEAQWNLQTQLKENSMRRVSIFFQHGSKLRV